MKTTEEKLWDIYSDLMKEDFLTKECKENAIHRMLQICGMSYAYPIEAYIDSLIIYIKEAHKYFELGETLKYKSDKWRD
ncbi:MAG: hypothetical protein LBC87_07365 [Fibromonadaceae bacterium]|jgi:hypothetical protein|nr:hypothetical protein [Fibromonadaceae bacterium]